MSIVREYPIKGAYNVHSFAFVGVAYYKPQLLLLNKNTKVDDILRFSYMGV